MHAKGLRAVWVSSCNSGSVGSGPTNAVGVLQGASVLQTHVTDRGMLSQLNSQHRRPDLGGRCCTVGRTHHPQTWCCSTAPALVHFTSCTCLFPWRGLQGAGEHCVLTAIGEEPGKYALILCNAIGMPLSTKQIPLEPVLLTMTPEHLVVASPDTIFVWRYDAEGASSSELPCGWQTDSEGGG